MYREQALEKLNEDREKFLLSQNTLDQISKIAFEITPVEIIAEQIKIPFPVFKKHLYKGDRIVGIAVLKGEWERLKKETDDFNKAKFCFLSKESFPIETEINGQIINKSIKLDLINYQVINDSFKRFNKDFLNHSFFNRLKRADERSLQYQSTQSGINNFSQLVINLNQIMDKQTGLLPRKDATFKPEHLALGKETIKEVLKREQ